MSDDNEIIAQLAQLTAQNAELQQKLAVADQKLAVADQNLTVADQNLAVADQKLAVADQNLAVADQKLSVVDQKETGKYWDTFENVWVFEPAEYADCFSAASELRKKHPCKLYAEVLVHILADGRSIETVLKDENAPSIFERESEASRSFVASGSSSFGSKTKSNRKEDKNHEKLYAKNIIGVRIARGNKTRAHTFPADRVCYRWWWPMYQVVTGSPENYNESAIQKLGSMRTSKFIFGGDHNLIYDNLTSGVVCTIPIFDSMEAMAKWEYGDGYKMLIIADSASSYRNLLVAQDTAHDHIQIATQAEVANATNLLAEMMKVMADSLVSNWDSHYSQVEEKDGRKKMLEDMRNLLIDDGIHKIHVPIVAYQEGADPKLYTIDYAVLYKDCHQEGAKYITDPLPALIKSAMNLSYFTTAKEYPDKKGCKLLPGCKSSFSSVEESSVHSYDILRLFDSKEENAPEKRFHGLIGTEIEVNVVSEAESDDSDDLTQ
jgi:hypothetical protein